MKIVVEHKGKQLGIVSFEDGKAVVDTAGRQTDDWNRMIIFERQIGIGEMTDKVLLTKFEGTYFALLAEITPLGAIYSENGIKHNDLKIYIV